MNSIIKRTIVICTILSLLLTGCGSSSGGSGKTASQSQSQVQSSVTGSPESATIEEQVLFDAKDVKITAKGLDTSMLGTDLNLLIENNTSKSIVVQARKTSVNGYMVGTSMSVELQPGKKANDKLTIYADGLKKAGIEQIATIELVFLVADSSTFNELFKTDVLKIDTSIAGLYQQKYDDSGEKLVDSNGVKIVYKGLSSDGTLTGPALSLYIENNTDKDIVVQDRGTSVNGFMTQTTMSEEITPGKKVVGKLELLQSDLDKNGVKDISDIELKFLIADGNSMDNIFTTDVIKIKP